MSSSASMIAITGATGHLGRAIIKELLPKTEAVRLVAVARTPEKVADLAGKGVAVRHGDYEIPETLVAAFEGADVLMFISNTDFTRREQQHKNVVDAAVQAGVGRIVYTGFIQTGNEDPLSLSHSSTEAYIQASGLQYTFLRDNFYMDLYAGEVQIAMKRGVYRSPTLPDAGASLVARGDIARAAASVLIGEGHAGKIYDMTGPSVVTPTVIADAASAISGRPVHHEQISWEELAGDYRQRGIDEPFIQLAMSVERMIASNILSGVSEDIARLTGTSAEDFLSFARRAVKRD